METNILVQEPLFNLTKLDFFNLAFKPDNSEWEKFLEELLISRFLNVRTSFQAKNFEQLRHHLHMVEGNFCIFKSELISDLIYKMKQKLSKNATDVQNEYIKFVNVSRVVLVYIIQMVFDKSKTNLNV